jgi:flagellar basal-body rod modification protein FlgD
MIEAITSPNILEQRSKEIQTQSERGGSSMQMDDFLQLLTAQIGNQDPLEPMKDTEFISQMANIASLEQMQEFSKGFESFASSHDKMVSQNYLGKDVVIEDEANTVSGIVTSVEKNADGELKVVVNGNSYDTSLISKVSLPDAIK